MRWFAWFDATHPKAYVYTGSDRGAWFARTHWGDTTSEGVSLETLKVHAARHGARLEILHSR